MILDCRHDRVISVYQLIFMDFYGRMKKMI